MGMRSNTHRRMAFCLMAAGLALPAVQSSAFAQERGLQERGFENRPGQRGAPAPRAPARGGGGDVLGHGETFLALGTRNSRDAAIIFAREYAGDFPSVSVARLTDGNWATFAGIIEMRASDDILRSLRTAGRIPNGSFLVPGARVDDIAWSPSGRVDHDTLELSRNAPRTAILGAMGIAGRWAARPLGCGDTQNEDLLETEMNIAPRSMRWGSFGSCEFGSIVRVNGGVFLDANCNRDGKRESFVLSLKRNGTRLTVETDPTEKNKLNYELQACTRGGGNIAVAPPTPGGGQAQPQRPPAGAAQNPPRTARAGGGETIPSSRPPAGNSEKPKSTGSGFFVSNSGVIVTNHHVINECSSVVVKGFGAAQILKADSENDLALLKVETQKPVSFLKVRTDPAKLGQDIVVFGFPLSSVLDNGLNVTTGIVSSEIGMHNDNRMLQFTAAIQPGNSGGPIVDRSGNLVAVVRSKFSDKFALERGSFVPQNLNYGIKTEVLLRFLGANGVGAEIANEQKDRTVAELAATARDHTLLVLCH